MRDPNVAVTKAGSLRDDYEASVGRGVDEDLAQVTLAWKIAAVAANVQGTERRTATA